MATIKAIKKAWVQLYCSGHITLPKLLEKVPEASNFLEALEGERAKYLKDLNI